jgi:hypothetical protein
MIKCYNSIAALRQDYVALTMDKLKHSQPPNISWYGGENEISWYGGETEANTLRLALTGDTKLVSVAETMLSQLETQIETPRPVWESSPAGSYVSIPDVLAGRPADMRRRGLAFGETAPITILATTTSSEAINAETLARRGTVILALVMALSRIRPVSLHQLTFLHGVDTGETVLTAQINTSPIDLATACYVLTSAGFARRLTYTIAKRINGFNGEWPNGFNIYNPKPYYTKLVAKLVAAGLASDPAQCLLIDAARYGDAMLTDPVTWINAQIQDAGASFAHTGA